MFNSARLKKLRKDLGLSQVQMCEKLNMEQSTYCKYEKNRSDLNLPLLQKLKDEFGVDPNEFLNNAVKKLEQDSKNLTGKISGGG